MYDNVDMTLHLDKSPNEDFLEKVPSLLSKVINHGNSIYGNYVIGYLNSLKVKVTRNYVKIYDSSICKYYLGDNFKTLSRGDTQRAVEKISDCLHLPFQYANVTRIDFANNLIMQYPEKVYYPYLGEAPYYERLCQPNGLYYSTKTGIRQLVLYGKVYEQKIKKHPTPELYINRNVLRYELRLRKRLREQLKRPEILAGLLYDEAFYFGMVERWKNEYFTIQKLKSRTNNIKPTGRVKEFIENLALITILEQGQPQILNQLKEWQGKGEINKNQAFNLRKSIKQLSTNHLMDQGNDLINELDRKIKEASKYQLSGLRYIIP